LDLDGLTPFEKNFYVESPSVAAMSDKEVEEYRLRREITVEGRDVPKPVKSFRDVGFPGNLLVEKCPLFSLFEVLFRFHLACM
jgi:ATP-dependent RNA helicase DDX5/DBP2